MKEKVVIGAFIAMLALAVPMLQRNNGVGNAPGGVTVRITTPQSHTMSGFPSVDCQFVVPFDVAEGDLASYWNPAQPDRVTISRSGYYGINCASTTLGADFQGNARVYNADDTPYSPPGGLSGYYGVAGQHWQQYSNGGQVFLTAGQYIQFKICTINTTVNVNYAEMSVVYLTS